MKTKFKSITAFLIYIFLPTIMLNLYGVDKTYFIGESIYVTQWLLIYIDFVTVTALSLLFKEELKSGFEKFKNDYKTLIPKLLKIWFLGIIGMITMSFFVQIIVGLGDISKNEEIIRNVIDIIPIYSGIAAVLIAPITEELTFREAIYKLTTNKFLFIFISSFLFSFIHIANDNFLQILPYFAMGIALSYAYYETKNIFSSIFIHMFHNLVQLILIFLI